MRQRSSQIQLQREIRSVSNKLNKLDIEVKLLIKDLSKQNNPGLEKGLKELSEGKGRLFKSMKQWASAMKTQG